MMLGGIHVSTTVNGDPVEFVCEPDETLLDVLRDRLGLTGAKEGCGTGDCGACSVIARRPPRLLLPRARRRSARAARSRPSKAWRDGDKLHPLQQQIHRACGAAMRHLHARLSGCGQGAARTQPGPERGRDPFLACRQSLPLHRIRQDRPRGHGRRQRNCRRSREHAARSNRAFDHRNSSRRHPAAASRRRRQGHRPRPLRRRCDRAGQARRPRAALARTPMRRSRRSTRRRPRSCQASRPSSPAPTCPT